MPAPHAEEISPAAPLADEPAHPPGVRRPPPLLWAAGVASAGIALVLALGFAIGRWPFALDRAVLDALYGAGSPALRSVMVDVTTLGGGTVLTTVVVVAAGLLLVRRLAITAALVVVATWSGSTLVQAFKGQFGRLRPPVDHLVEVSGMSFPSGHAANSAIVYLTLAALVTQVTPRRATRRYIVAVAVLLVGAIGISRVYLGVHWPSDVLAGWSFGTLWALGWWWTGAHLRAAAGR